MMVWSAPGDLAANHESNQGPGMYVGARQSSQNVVVAGVTGTRRTYLVTADNPLPPPKGTVQVLYTFVTGGRTYFAQYDRHPGEADLTSGFDQMITGSLAFSG